MAAASNARHVLLADDDWKQRESLLAATEAHVGTDYNSSRKWLADFFDACEPQLIFDLCRAALAAQPSGGAPETAPLTDAVKHFLSVWGKYAIDGPHVYKAVEALHAALGAASRETTDG
jgi:hypothetical protein